MAHYKNIELHQFNNQDIQAAYAQFDRDGVIAFKDILSNEEVESLRLATNKHLRKCYVGRNDFEGQKTNRVYNLIAKGAEFGELAAHPLVMKFAERELGASFLLSSCLAINLLPGETPQPWHTDDGHITIARPHPPFGLSAFWMIDETTSDNGATEFLIGSHKWGDEQFSNRVRDEDFTHRKTKSDRDFSTDLTITRTIAPSGSLVIAKGTVWHRGGPNNSDRPRLLITPQYCPGWARQLENFMLGVPENIAKGLPERVQELIGYSIHSPFMGYIDGRHPKKILL